MALLHRNKPEELPMGLISFILQVETFGAIGEVVVYFSEAAPSEAKWYKYTPVNGWQDYSDHAVFSDDRKSITLEFKDGGFGDADDTENGKIIDPSGLGLFSSSPPSGDAGDNGAGGGGGGGCFISNSAVD